MAYITWIDAKEHVDTAAVGDLDPAKAQRLAADAEARLDNRLRKHMAVPIGRDTSPEAFRQAKEICARWTAAEYIRWKLSAEGTKETTWFADHLDRQAEELLEEMIDRLRQPTDAKASENAICYTPFSGGQPPAPALFHRSHVRELPTGGDRW